jgi:hypothetical protein
MRTASALDHRGSVGLSPMPPNSPAPKLFDSHEPAGCHRRDESRRQGPTRAADPEWVDSRGGHNLSWSEEFAAPGLPGDFSPLCDATHSSDLPALKNLSSLRPAAGIAAALSSLATSLPTSLQVGGQAGGLGTAVRDGEGEGRPTRHVVGPDVSGAAAVPRRRAVFAPVRGVLQASLRCGQPPSVEVSQLDFPSATCHCHLQPPGRRECRPTGRVSGDLRVRDAAGADGVEGRKATTV